MTVRGYGRASRRGGGNPPLQRALRKFGFHAPLTQDVFLDRGYGAASFTRATTATVKDWEGAIRKCLSGEVRFAGQRRVHNNIGGHTTNTTSPDGSLFSSTRTTGIADPDGGTNAVTFTASGANGSIYSNLGFNYPAGEQVVVSLWIRRRTGTGNITLTAGGATATSIQAAVDSTWRRVSAQLTATGAQPTAWNLSLVTSGDAVDIYKVQSEIVTGQSNQNPSEYVSVGAAKSNYAVYTDELAGSGWVKENVTVAYDSAVAAPANSLAFKITETAISGVHDTYHNPTATLTAETYVASAYLKAGTRGFGGVSLFQGAAQFFTVVIDLATGAVTDTETGASTVGTSYSVADAGNGWWRVSVSCTATAAGWLLVPFTADSGTPAYVNGRATFLGEITKYIYVSAPQIEKGVTASTYFPVGSVYPYHGACVDGVKYFSTENGNTVASNVVTEATGAAITRPEGDGLTNGLVLPGVDNNGATVPDAAYWPTGSLDYIVRVSSADWTPPSIYALFTHGSGAANMSFRVYINLSGTIVVIYSIDGTASISAESSTAPTVSNGQTIWLRVTRDSTSGDWKFYQAADASAVPSSWTQIGTTISGTAGSLFNSTESARIGCRGDLANTLNGAIYRAIVKDGIDGTTVFDADFTAQEIGATSFTESSANAATVTVNTSGTVPAYIGNPLRVFNYEGYLAESARTNLVLQSSNFGTTWGALGTPTRSAAAAYCGEIALDLIGDDTAGALEGYDQPLNYTGNATKSISFLVKQGTSTSTVVRANDTSAPADRLLVAITWSGGAPVCTYTTGSAERASEYMGGGVWRIFCLTASITAANLNYLKFYPATDAALSIANTGDIYIGGVQAENATTASASHIPTTTATVTRNADGLTYPAPGHAGASGGTVYGEGFVSMYAGPSHRFVSVNATVDRMMDLYWVSSTTVSAYAAGGGYQDASLVGNPQRNTIVKVVAALATNDAIKCVNGALGTLDTTVTPPASPTTIMPGAYGAADMEGVVRNIRVSSLRVPDADLQLITQ